MSPAELKNWRYDRDYTQRELSTALGIHRVILARYEAGMTKIPTLLDLALKGLEAQGGEPIPRTRKRKRKRQGG
jgi:transcriptional regulator with XRE-family HTH domain